MVQDILAEAKECWEKAKEAGFGLRLI